MRDRKAHHWGWLLLSLGIFCVCVVGLALFRMHYYGRLLPNTYTLKIEGIPLSARISDGLGFIRPFILFSSPVLCIAVIGLLFQFSARSILLVLIVCSAIAYQIYVGGDPWAYWRMLAPTMPLALLLFATAVVNMLEALPVLRSRIAALWGRSALFWLAMLIGLLMLNFQFLPEIFFVKRPFTAPENERNVNIALALMQVTAPHATVGVIWAGAIPYYVDRHAIDFLGKSDAYIAQLPPDLSGSVSWSGMNHVPGHTKYDLDYSIKTLLPTYVQNLNWGRQSLHSWAAVQYVLVRYRGVALMLRANSSAVRWERLDR